MGPHFLPRGPRTFIYGPIVPLSRTAVVCLPGWSLKAPYWSSLQIEDNDTELYQKGITGFSAAAQPPCVKFYLSAEAVQLCLDFHCVSCVPLAGAQRMKPDLGKQPAELAFSLGCCRATPKPWEMGCLTLTLIKEKSAMGLI